MTGKEALEEVKDTHITKWDEAGVYTMNFKDTISYKILENEMDRLEKADKELAKYKRAFEILKRKGLRIVEYDADEYSQYLNFTKGVDTDLEPEEAELLEELIKDDR